MSAKYEPFDDGRRSSGYSAGVGCPQDDARVARKLKPRGMEMHERLPRGNQKSTKGEEGRGAGRGEGGEHVWFDNSESCATKDEYELQQQSPQQHHHLKQQLQHDQQQPHYDRPISRRDVSPEGASSTFSFNSTTEEGVVGAR